MCVQYIRSMRVNSRVSIEALPAVHYTRHIRSQAASLRSSRAPPTASSFSLSGFMYMYIYNYQKLLLLLLLLLHHRGVNKNKLDKYVYVNNIFIHTEGRPFPLILTIPLTPRMKTLQYLV